jgi:hypothetical protein
MKKAIYAIAVAVFIIACGKPSFCDCVKKGIECQKASEDKQKECEKIQKKCKEEFGNLPQQEKMEMMKNCFQNRD